MHDTGAVACDATVLSNGRYRVLLSTAGSGVSALGDHVITRWTADRTQDADGFFLYVRDLELNVVWSAGLQPVRRTPDRYAARFEGGLAVIERRDEAIETSTTVAVARDQDIECRRVTLHNLDLRPRRLELTTYVEAVLATPWADAKHPAFGKLFIETEWAPDPGALLAHHRRRSLDEAPIWVAHALVLEDPVSRAHPCTFETDRARFIGRGRSLAAPAALEPFARLSGTIGSVLDPVLAIRRAVVLEPGQSVALLALLTAGPSREDVLGAIAGGAVSGAADRLFARPAQAAPSERAHIAWLWDRDGQVPVPPAGAGAGERFRPAPGVDLDVPADEQLRFFNGFGGFSADGTEYVIRLARRTSGLTLPPLPWVNVVANEAAGFIASERGLGSTWVGNSRENRLTPWYNDPVTDPPGEALYLRDEQAGVFWSPTPGPVPGSGPYEVRHGFGYTTYKHTSLDLEQETVSFVPRDNPVKLVRLRIANRGAAVRRLSAFWYVEWVLGTLRQASADGVVTEHDRDSTAMFAIQNGGGGGYAGHVAFAALVPCDGARVTWTGDRTEFLGRRESPDRPAALSSSSELDGRTGAGLDPCAAFQATFELAPGAAAQCVFALGQAADHAAARDLIRRYGSGAAVEAALDEVRAFWRDLVDGVQIETPAPAIDVMVNGWLTYQNLSCRIWGRSAFYQSSGAYGFRDQLQDAAALLPLRPDLTRRQILLHAAHQFVEGDVLHWWHPPAAKGIRTRFSDDLLWLPHATLSYLDVTGDATLLDENARFLTAPELAPHEDEALVVPAVAGEPGTVYEHCCRAIDRSLTRGAHGLPLMGTGDWNDGMNRVGRGGRGESVWLGFFLHDILRRFAPLAIRRGDAAHADRYRTFGRDLGAALNDAGWDGRWYRRAFYDDGTALGSAANEECRIDAIAQAWSILSGVAPADRAAQALDALEEHLVAESEGLIRLLTPPFDHTRSDPGYIRGYLPGVRENGGQYTHAALWAVRALAEGGRTERAARLLEMLSPVTRTRTPDLVARYRTEPYAVAADVYGAAPHVGRGGWTWYTGSAGWMFRVALESVLGVSLQDGRTLAIRPCIPGDWPGFTVHLRLPDRRATYEIVVRRAPPAADDRTTASCSDGPVSVEDGTVRVPVAADGRTHRVEVLLGRDAAPRYRPKAWDTPAPW